MSRHWGLYMVYKGKPTKFQPQLGPPKLKKHLCELPWPGPSRGDRQEAHSERAACASWKQQQKSVSVWSPAKKQHMVVSAMSVCVCVGVSGCVGVFVGECVREVR